MLERDWTDEAGDATTWEATARQASDDLLYTAADLQQARTEGRREANSAIDWHTTCVGCAHRLDKSITDHADGGADAARQILHRLAAIAGEADGVRADVLREVQELVRRYA